MRPNLSSEKKRIGKRADTPSAGMLTILGLVAGVIILVIVAKGMGIGFDTLGKLFKEILQTQAENVVNPPSLYTKASGANFKRLNSEIARLNELGGNNGNVIPYTLGQYRLVGFSKLGDEANIACLGAEMLAIRESKCKDKACLCLCQKEEKCECIVYDNVDYFITKDKYRRSEGNKLEGVKDPRTGKDAYCLYFKGADNEDNTLKLFESYDSWFHSKNIYVERTRKDGKNFIFIDEYTDVRYSPRMFGTGQAQGDDTENTAVSNTDEERCGELASCLDYKTKNIGIDWKIACENEVCKGKGNELVCEVVDNPYAQKEEDKSLCLEEGSTISGICLPSEEKGYPFARKGSFALNLKDKENCMECKGMGEKEADSFGWFGEVEAKNCQAS